MLLVILNKWWDKSQYHLMCKHREAQNGRYRMVSIVHHVTLVEGTVTLYICRDFTGLYCSEVEWGRGEGSYRTFLYSKSVWWTLYSWTWCHGGWQVSGRGPCVLTRVKRIPRQSWCIGWFSEYITLQYRGYTIIHISSKNNFHIHPLDTFDISW